MVFLKTIWLTTMRYIHDSRTKFCTKKSTATSSKIILRLVWRSYTSLSRFYLYKLHSAGFVTVWVGESSFKSSMLLPYYWMKKRLDAERVIRPNTLMYNVIVFRWSKETNFIIKTIIINFETLLIYYIKSEV